MTRRCEFRPLAEQDLDQIWDYTEARWGMAQARSYIRLLREAVDRVTENPSIGSLQSGRTARYRKLKVASHSIFYRYDDATTTIVRILHARMDSGRVAEDETAQ